MKSENGHRNGWIGVDLDGTLAFYDKWVNHVYIGAPIPEMVARVKAWLDAGHRVKIFTARVSSDGSMRRDHEVAETRLAIADWCSVYLGQALPITNVKDLSMVELWDDRAVQVLTNKGTPVGRSMRYL